MIPAGTPRPIGMRTTSGVPGTRIPAAARRCRRVRHAGRRLRLRMLRRIAPRTGLRRRSRISIVATRRRTTVPGTPLPCSGSIPGGRPRPTETARAVPGIGILADDGRCRRACRAGRRRRPKMRPRTTTRGGVRRGTKPVAARRHHGTIEPTRNAGIGRRVSYARMVTEPLPGEPVAHRHSASSALAPG